MENPIKIDDLRVYIAKIQLLCLTYTLFAQQEGGTYVAVQPSGVRTAGMVNTEKTPHILVFWGSWI